MSELEILYKEWLKDEIEKLSRGKIVDEEKKAKRSYIHFDKRRSPSSLFRSTKNLINVEEIKKTPFWPFLKITLEEIRIKNSNDPLVKRKKDPKKRDIYYAAHHDALVYSWYSFLLNKKYYEPVLKDFNIEKNVIAYRKIPLQEGGNKCNIHFAKEIFDFIRNTQEDCVAFVADITKFFDTLDHDHLKSEWLKCLNLTEYDPLPDDHEIIYKNLTRFKYVDAKDLYKTFDIKYKTKKIKLDGKVKAIKAPYINNNKINSILSLSPSPRKDFISKVVHNHLIKGNQNWNPEKKCLRGIMQGSPISATLANLYMISFDKAIASLVEEKGGVYRRYSDDIVVVCSVSDYGILNHSVLEEIQKYNLEINPAKTKVVFFKKNHRGELVGVGHKNKKEIPLNLQYLGFEFNGRDVFIRSRSLTKYYRKMKAKIRKAVSMAYGNRSKTKQAGNLIFTKHLREKFLRGGERSFISYALRANEIMGGDTIKKQLENRFNIMSQYLMQKELEKQVKK